MQIIVGPLFTFSPAHCARPSHYQLFGHFLLYELLTQQPAPPLCSIVQCIVCLPCSLRHIARGCEINVILQFCKIHIYHIDTGYSVNIFIFPSYCLRFQMILLYFAYYCLRSRPIYPNVVSELVSFISAKSKIERNNSN